MKEGIWEGPVFMFAAIGEVYVGKPN